MPVATIQTPDGKTMTMEVPEGATEQQILAFAQKSYQAAPQQPAADPVQEGDSFIKDVRDVAGEFAAGANRAVVNTIDFIGPDTINAGLRLAGSDTQVPTLRETLAPTGIEGGFMEEGVARDAVGAAGNTLAAAGGLIQVPRNVATAGGAAAEFLGLGSAKVPAALSPAIGQKIGLLRQTGDANTAGVMLDQAGNVVKDKAAKATISQGFEPGFVAMVKSASSDTRKKMLAMLDIVEKGKQNYRFGADNRPLDIAGDSVLNRVKVVREANRIAARRLDGVAQALKGQSADPAPAVNAFIQSLDDMGIKFDPNTAKVVFDGSDIEKLPGPQRVVKNILNRMLNTKTPDAHDLHRLKRFIDEQVSYGKSASGLGGRVEGIMKTLRHDIDGILDTNFAAYNKVNTQYSETRGALDAIQDVAGKKMDLYGDDADKALGTLTRRLLSNAQSRVNLRDAVSQLDETARKYLKPGNDVVPFKAVASRANITPAALDNDDLLGLVSFADEMDKAFGAASKTSLLGDVEKGVGTGIDAALGQKTAAGMTAEGLKWGYQKAKGINEENAIKSLRELLKRGASSP